jgi:hypothetical protein
MPSCNKKMKSGGKVKKDCKKMASGGKARGCGAATRGTGYSKKMG